MIDYSLQTMQRGDHFCLFYRTLEEQRRVVIPFLATGLQRGERCVFLGDEASVGTVAEGLAKAGVDVRAERRRDALILESGHGHLVDGRFDPDSMITFLGKIVDDAVASGFSGWRATGDSHWEMGEHPDYPALERYEALLDRFFHNRPMVGMCQHDLRRMPQDVVQALLASHRKVVLAGRLTDSHCYHQTVADVETFLAKQPQVDSQLDRPARHLDLMLSSISEAVFAHNRDGHLIYANRAGRKLLMVPAYSAVFKEIAAPAGHDIDFHGEDGRPLASKDLPWRVALRERRPSERFIRCPDPWLNRDRWWLAKAMPLYESAEMFEHCVTVVEDVTESRALKDANTRLELQIAETERLNLHVSQQQVLFREVHHRIKNNLQVLTNMVAVLGLRFRGDEVAEALDDLQNRIDAMSLVHDLLYRRGKESTVDLADYLRALAERVVSTLGALQRGIKLGVSAVACPASMDTAIAVGLIVSELLTNAAKHAFPAGRPGEIQISLAPDGGDRWRLLVGDNGVGAASAAASDSGIGSGLIRSLAAQIGGEMTVQSANGTQVQVTFSAS